MQNKWLELLLNPDRYTPMHLLKSNLSQLKAEGIYKGNVLSFDNECRSNRYPDAFENYDKIRESDYEPRHTGRLEMPELT